MKRPTNSDLSRISQPTTTTLAEKQVPSPPPTSEKVKTFAGIPIPWLGTLPKPKEKKQSTKSQNSESRSNTQQSNGSMSVVAPHHATSGTTQIMVEQKSPGNLGIPVAVQVPGGAVKSLNTTLTDHVGVPLSPESSDDSSITPSPNGQGRTTWRGNAGDTSTSTSSSDILSSGMATTDRRYHPYNKPGLDPYLNRKSHHNHKASSMSLDDTSSDDSTYPSQYQSDANSTPRTGTSQTLPRNLPGKSVIHHSGTHGNIGGMGLSNVKVKSMNDYEAEILQMRSEMEHLQIKLSEAERRLQFSSSNSSNESSPSKSTITTAEQDQSKFSNSDQDMAKEVVQRLTREEEKLRNDQ